MSKIAVYILRSCGYLVAFAAMVTLMFIFSFGLSNESVPAILGVAAYFCVFSVVPIVFAAVKAQKRKKWYWAVSILLTVLAAAFFILNGWFYQRGMDNYLVGHGDFDTAAAEVMPSAEQLADAQQIRHIYRHQIYTHEEYMSLEFTCEKELWDVFVSDSDLAQTHAIGDYSCVLLTQGENIYSASVKGFCEDSRRVVFLYFHSEDLSSLDVWDFVENEFDYCFE